MKIGRAYSEAPTLITPNTQIGKDRGVVNLLAKF